MKITYTLSEIDSVAAQLLSQTRSSIFLFKGEMGAGKTTLIKTLVRNLGVEEAVSSPTFSIVNEYRTSKQEVVYHFDFYRIEHEEELLDIGVEDYFSNGDWIFIEWPEKAMHLLPENASIIELSLTKDGKRVIHVK